MLNKSPKKRISAKKALQLPLFKVCKAGLKERSITLLRDNIGIKINRRKKLNVIKNGMLIFMAVRLLPEARYTEIT